MFSVIIPTMWRSNELMKSLPLLDRCPVVGEILLINNDVAKTPEWFKTTNWVKVKVFNPPSNIFVNPAFNLGISQCHYDKLCLLQVDILFDTTILNLLYNVVTPDRGCIGFDSKFLVMQLADQLSPIPIREISLIPLKEREKEKLFGYAFILFLHKSNFIPIDEDMKIHLGECWISYTHEKKGKIPLVLQNFYATASNMCTTSEHAQFKQYLDREHNLQQSIKAKLYIIFSKT
jgi:hypothetical protein